MKNTFFLTIFLYNCAIFPNSHWEFKNNEDIRCSTQCLSIQSECTKTYDSTLGDHRDKLNARNKCFYDADKCFRFCGGIEVKD